MLSSRYSLGKFVGGQHTGTGYGQKYFMEYPKWAQFVNNFVPRWREGFEWLVDVPPGHRLLVVSFEELKKDKVAAVHRMLEFLKLNIKSKADEGRCVWVDFVSKYASYSRTFPSSICQNTRAYI